MSLADQDRKTARKKGLIAGAATAGSVALIATAKAFRDPRQVISDVLPQPLEDVPGIVTEVRRIEENQSQTQTPPDEQVNTSPPPTER